MDKDPFLRSFLYFFEYSHDVLKKKTKVLDIFYYIKKSFMKINIKTSPPEILIRIRFNIFKRAQELNTLSYDFDSSYT